MTQRYTVAASLTVLRDDRRRLWVLAAIAFVVVVVSIGEAGGGPLAWTLLPPVAIVFVAKAIVPDLPDLVPAVPALVLPMVLNMPATDAEFAMFLVALGTTLMAMRAPNRLLANGYLVLAVGNIFVLSIVGVYDWAWLNWAAGTILAWAMGSLLHYYDRIVDELEATRAQMVDQATMLERRRIARDVHDLVGHSLAVVTLHVAGARRLIRTDPDEAEAALADAEAAGRRSMAELRRTIDLLRDDDDIGDPGPTPDLSDLATVVEQYRNAGLDISYRSDGPIERVDVARSVACFRIAQEAIANVTKHTVGSQVEVAVDATEEQCQLRVRSWGGRPVEGSGATSPGHGLIGMRERALSAGGSLIAGPTADGWSIDAVFPQNGVGAERGAGPRQGDW